jgi:hypothetical protein
MTYVTRVLASALFAVSLVSGVASADTLADVKKSADT